MYTVVEKTLEFHSGRGRSRSEVFRADVSRAAIAMRGLRLSLVRQILSFLLCTVSLAAQSSKFNHAVWKLTLDQSSAVPGATVMGRLEATIDPDWHMYSLTTPTGPIPTTIELSGGPAVDGVTYFEPPTVRKFDPNFNADTETYEGTQAFLARIQLKKDAPAGPARITFVPRYQTCSGTSCIPPRTRTVTTTLTIAPSVPPVSVAIPAGYTEVKPGTSAALVAAAAGTTGQPKTAAGAD